MLATMHTFTQQVGIAIVVGDWLPLLCVGTCGAEEARRAQKRILLLIIGTAWQSCDLHVRWMLL